MAKHIVIVSRGGKTHTAAQRRLTYLGQKKGLGLIYGDLGLKKNWDAYKKELARL